MGWAMGRGTSRGVDDRLGIAGTGRVLRRTAGHLRPYLGRAIAAALLLIAWTALTMAELDRLFLRGR